MVTLQDRAIHHIEGTERPRYRFGTEPPYRLCGRSTLGGLRRRRRDPQDHRTEQRALISQSEGSEVKATGNRVDLTFADYNGQSTLTKALVNGNGFLESKPLPVAGKDPAETRILRSEVIEIAMRPGGKELDSLTTDAPGTLEFLPNHAGSGIANLSGNGCGSLTARRIGCNRSVRSSAARKATHSGRTCQDVAETITVSQNVLATFDPKTSQLARMEQWRSFPTSKAIARRARSGAFWSRPRTGSRCRITRACGTAREHHRRPHRAGREVR